MKTPGLVVGLLVGAVAVTGCDEEAIANAVEAKAKEAIEKEAAKSGDGGGEAAKEAEAPPEMIDFDLGSADPEWEGWKAQGPKGAKVLKDGVKGARIAANGRHGFDLQFAPKKKDLTQYKASIEKGVEASEGKSKVTWIVDKPEHLEWTREGYGSTSYNFMMHMNVDGRDVTCQNNVMMGIEGKDRLQMHKDACKTLKKGG